MNSVNTELAKNVILCGMNIDIYDDSIITLDDIDTNFMLGPNDIGLKVTYSKNLNATKYFF